MRELVPGLPARRRALQDQHVQPLGRAVDGGGQPRRPAADDHHLAHLRRIEVGAEAEADGQHLDGRVLEDVAAAADDHRHVVDADVKAIEQHLDAGSVSTSW